MAKKKMESKDYVIKYLQEFFTEFGTDAHITVKDVADALNYTPSQVGIIFRGLKTRGLAYDTMAKIELEDGTIKDVKFIYLTDVGMGHPIL